MMSSVRTFRTQPPTGPDESFSFVVYGDMGLSLDPGAHDTAKYMIEEAKKGKSLVFHVGDISYARGYVSWTVNKSFSSLIRLHWSEMFFLKNGVHEFCARKVIGRQQTDPDSRVTKK